MVAFTIGGAVLVVGGVLLLLVAMCMMAAQGDRQLFMARRELDRRDREMAELGRERVGL